jgi:phage-related minor tail protein
MALHEETVHGWSCKFYQGDVVKIGTKASRFTLKVPADEVSWFATRLRAELIRRELASATELPVDEAGEAALAAKAAAAGKRAAERAASQQTAADRAASPRRKAAAKVEAAAHHEMIAGQKRKLAEAELKYAKVTAKVAQAAPLVAGLAKVASAPLQTKLESFLQRCPM